MPKFCLFQNTLNNNDNKLQIKITITHLKILLKYYLSPTEIHLTNHVIVRAFDFTCEQGLPGSNKLMN